MYCMFLASFITSNCIDVSEQICVMLIVTISIQYEMCIQQKAVEPYKASHLTSRMIAYLEKNGIHEFVSVGGKTSILGYSHRISVVD